MNLKQITDNYLNLDYFKAFLILHHVYNYFEEFTVQNIKFCSISMLISIKIFTIKYK